MAEVMKLNPTRTHDMVPFEEFEEVLTLVKTMTVASEAEIMHLIGYTGSSSAEGRRTGKIAKRAKYAIIGLAAELKLEASLKSRPAPRTFSYDELGLLFAGLNNFPLPEDRRRLLITKVMAEMQKATQE